MFQVPAPNQTDMSCLEMQPFLKDESVLRHTTKKCSVIMKQTHVQLLVHLRVQMLVQLRVQLLV